VYECPTPSNVGDITHLRWRGLLGPEFVQSIIDTGLANIKAADNAPTETKPFIAITSHAYPVSPVSYIPPSTLTGTASALENPVRLPRRDGEDTWCLLAVPGDSSPLEEWALVESLGQYDARWG